MKKTLLILMVAAVALFAEGIRWEPNFNAAVTKAKEVKKPIMFVFSSHGCKWCRHLEKTTFSDPKVIEALNSDFVNVIAYTDARDYVPRELWLPGTPGIWFLDSSGEPMFQPIQGAVDPESMIQAAGIVKKEYQKLLVKERYGAKGGK